VPFTLRPMDKDSAHSLVHGLLPAEATDEKPDADEKTKPMPQPNDEEGRDPIEPLPRPEVVPVTPIEPAPPFDTRTLVLTQAELDFAAVVAAGLRTPRTVKKFTNLYRLLRAGLDERSGVLEHFLREDTGDTPEYQAVLILLAAIIAFTDDAPGFLAGLLQQPTTNGDLWVDYLRDVKPPKRGGICWRFSTRSPQRTVAILNGRVSRSGAGRLRSRATPSRPARRYSRTSTAHLHHPPPESPRTVSR
jgi:hypothetical protein